nr:23S rRNA (uracil(1939)-C(5))-methyltransferase RlmD [Lachnospiraceae bacterium]
GQDYITDVIEDVKYQISPLSFFQVNPVQTAALYKKVLEYAGLTGEETVWDLYCGIGSISLFLARQAKQVYGVEIVPQAIADAKHNAQLNRITNAEFFVGRAEEVLPNMYGAGQGPLQTGRLVDVIVVDPPRKGCEESLLETIVKISPKRMVYVSCDPATLARDIKYMTAHGYRLEQVCAVDQFCHSPHVETVVLMSRVEK